MALFTLTLSVFDIIMSTTATIGKSSKFATQDSILCVIVELGVTSFE